MKIISAGKNPPPEILDFVCNYEKYCISLADRLLKQDTDIFCILDEKSMIRGVFSYSDGGQILHCLPDFFCRDFLTPKIEENQNSILKLLTAFFTKFDLSKLFSVIGEELSTDGILRAIAAAKKLSPEFINQFMLMECNRDKNSDFSSCGMESDAVILQCSLTQDVLEMLLPVQEAYEREEVLSAGQEFKPAVSRFMLRRALAARHVYVELYKSQFVAKAAINGEGRNYVQLGGLYTVKNFRRKGFARHLVQKLVKEIKSQGKCVALFVKKKNFAAEKLYESCGFTAFAGFKICYYGKP